MRSLGPVLLPAAATALAVTTVSTVALPSTPSSPPTPSTVPISATRVVGPAPGEVPRALEPAAPPRRAAPRSRWTWPLQPRPPVARRFIRPRSTWGAGHRGVDLTSAAGAEVRAVDAGVVGHVGVIAGRPTVTVVHRSGLRSTYEPVDAVVTVGDEVGQGQQIGTLTAGGHCPPAACLHLGALRGGVYLDPLTLLGATRVRLLPLRGER
ncbi:MAG: M23 family metallopeptidase [Pedococcus sp.]